MYVITYDRAFNSLDMYIRQPILALFHNLAIVETRQELYGVVTYTVHVFVRKDIWEADVWQELLLKAVSSLGNVVYSGPYVTGFVCATTLESSLDRIKEVAKGLFC